MRKLIELKKQDNLVVCDNVTCGVTIAASTDTPIEEMKQYINKPCPECGRNLCTQKDYDNYVSIMKVINWMNKYFSWLTFFAKEKKTPTEVVIKSYNGIRIKKT